MLPASAPYNENQIDQNDRIRKCCQINSDFNNRLSELQPKRLRPMLLQIEMSNKHQN
jgi:hypothetical protein